MIAEKSLNSLSKSAPKATFDNFKATSARIAQLEVALGLPPSKAEFFISRANARIAQLEAMLADRAAAAPVAAGVPAEQKIEELQSALVVQIQKTRDAELKAAPAAPGLTGKARWDASVRRDAAAQAKPAQHSNLSGRQRFKASLPGTTAATKDTAQPVAATGRDRFKNAVAKDFANR